MSPPPQPLARANVVAAVAEALDQALLCPQYEAITVFEADVKHPPQISIVDYLTRWSWYSGADNEVMILALIYVQRSGVALNSLTVHRLLLAALVLATKCNNDYFYSNTFYAVVGGVAIEEVNRIETALLEAVDWRLTVPKDEYEAVCDKLFRKDKQSPVLFSRRASLTDSEGISSEDSMDSTCDLKQRGKFDCIREVSVIIWRYFSGEDEVRV